MSDHIHHEKSTLELFPDELFLELFSFIKPIDLYYSFSGLNSRLNNILHDIDIYIHIINNDQCEQYKNCMDFFASQIIYLAIDCHWTCLSYEINLRPFINLQSLHLPMPSEEQCRDIRPQYFSHLTHLTINNNTFKLILFSLKSFPNLISCHVQRVYSSIIYRIEPVQLCLTLQSLHLYFCSINDLFDILQFVPNLKYLEIGSTSINESLPCSEIKHKHLAHLKVKLLQLEPYLEILLMSMPNLSRLEFLWNGYQQPWGVTGKFDFEKFACILDKNSNSLKRVDINLRLFECDYDIETIRCLNPQWFSLLSIERILDDDSVFITTKRLSSNTKEIMIMNLLQSTYMTQRNKRVSRAKS